MASLFFRKKKTWKPPQPSPSEVKKAKKTSNNKSKIPVVAARPPLELQENVDPVRNQFTTFESPKRSSKKSKKAPPPPPRTSSEKPAGAAATNHQDTAAANEPKKRPPENPEVSRIIDNLINSKFDLTPTSSDVGEEDDDDQQFEGQRSGGDGGWRSVPLESWQEGEVLAWLGSVGLDYFIDLFEGCGIDGDYLIMVTQQDLLDLEIEDEEVQKQFLTEVAKLREEMGKRPPATELSNQQENLATSAHLSQPALDTAAFQDWEENEVVAWLQATGLNQFTRNFKEHHVTGRDLKNMTLDLLDDLQVKRAEDREMLLSKIYELHRPDSKHHADNLLSDGAQFKGHDRSKLEASVSALGSGEPVVLAPQPAKPARQSHSKSTPAPAAPSDAPRPPATAPSDVDSKSISSTSTEGAEERRKKTAAPKPVPAARDVSPWKKEKDSNSVQVWSVFSDPGTPYCNTYRLEESTTTGQLVQMSLRGLSICEDPKLFYIAESPVTHSSQSGTHRDVGRELGAGECPLSVQRAWPNLSTYRFELRQRTGEEIKIAYRIAGQRPRGKVFSVSERTSCVEALVVALAKVSLDQADPMLFCLLQVDNIHGDIRPVELDQLVLSLASDSFILCDKANLHQQIQQATGEDLDTLLERSSSLNSRSSSRLSVGSSGMASIELDTAEERNQSGELREQLQQALKEQHRLSALLHDVQEKMKNKENMVSLIQQENTKLQERSKQLKIFQEAVAHLEDNFYRLGEDARSRVSQRSSEGRAPSGSAGLEQALEKLGQQINAQDSLIYGTRQQLQALSTSKHHSAEAAAQQSELEVKLVSEEVKLLGLLQQQNSALSSLEVAQVEEELGAAKAHSGEAFLFGKMAAEEEYTMVAIEFTVDNCGYNFSLRNTPNGRLVVKSCAPESSLRPGDWILEINGRYVTQAAASEVLQTLLGSGRPAKVVVLRSQEAREQVPKAELEAVKQKFVQVKGQIEAEKARSASLNQQVQRMAELEQKAERADDLEVRLAEAEGALSAWSEKYRRLEEGARSDSQREALDRQLQADRLGSEKAFLQEEVASLRGSLQETQARLETTQNSVQYKDERLTSVTRERDGALQSLNELQTVAVNKKRASEFTSQEDDDLPIWEVMKSATKGELLEVLRLRVEESSRQKSYLDQMYALVLDQAPALLQQMDQQFQDSDISGDEEFC